MASPRTAFGCNLQSTGGDLTPERTLGVDIGGANLKLADANGRSLSVSFPMWTHACHLAEALRDLLQQFGAEHRCRAGHLAVTMTGELADCFSSRRDGVHHIVEQLACAHPLDNTSIYAVGGQWLSPAEAAANPWQVAASNWHALAEWLHRSQLWKAAAATPHELLAVVDIGSTTVDVIPMNAAGVATHARTDRDRLQLGQLVYTGMRRTPVASILPRVRLGVLDCPLMAERFATSDDAYLTLGLVPEAPADHDTADGRARTKPCAQSRLARMVGEDIETLAAEQIESMASQIIAAQAEQVASAINRNLAHTRSVRQVDQARPSLILPPTILISGHGRPLFERVRPLLNVPQCQFVWLEELLSPAAARVGPAMGVAWLFDHATHPHRS